MSNRTPSRSTAVLFAAGIGILLAGCGGTPEEEKGEPPVDEGTPSSSCDPAASPSRTLSCIESFSPGEGAGFGQDELPDIVYGEPHGGGEKKGGLDVLSLGAGGEIIVGFGGNSIVDGPGPDFIVFENAFYVGGDPAKPWKELAEVSVSDDGKTFVPFPCASAAYPYEGCAGWRAVASSSESGISPFDPEVAGGDPFDLAAIGIASARFVRIRDLSSAGGAPSAGFDLDATTIVNAAVP